MDNDPIPMFGDEEHAKIELEQTEIDYGVLASRELEYARAASLIIHEKTTPDGTHHLESNPYDEAQRINDDVRVDDDTVYITRVLQTDGAPDIRIEVALSDVAVRFVKDGEPVDMSKGDYDSFQAASYMSMLVMDVGLRLE